MNVSIGELIVQADAAMSGLQHAPSTTMQYRWAWSQFARFCSRDGIDEFREEAVAAFIEFVAAEYRDGRFKGWKSKLLRKAALVLSEVARTGSYEWCLARPAHPNDALDVVFRPVQEQFERWLQGRSLAVSTQNLYATVSRAALAWLPDRGVADARALSRMDVSAMVVFLGSRYQPGSMRTVLSALRVLCRFWEESGYGVGLSQAVPAQRVRRVRSVGVISADGVDALVNSAAVSTPMGLRDRAMLLVGARTGLRPVDIAGLRLRDIDWPHARITLTQHKTGASVTLPLLAEVGEAIAEYLLHGRPVDGDDDHVFLRSHAPYVGLTLSHSLYWVAARAFARSGTVTQNGTGRGFRVLRASFATRLLADGTPLPVISGALGHRGITSAKHYLSADDERMRECCLDFAGIEPRGAL
ncbi:tyrosine-type recombinase/integrase [Cryobacterium sp. SO1]|uniref:tyrosine-type recombinase/integrase n=1 Tax=Cryobacterium sp. SO1 TaxID=1897061 RepID=UPI0010D45A3F|nr:tyrosine-type recombinase/integrase [Cryobacterium sp. SO1]RZI35586.1 Tyrosine recombinase XerD [Cryobacterium sp. SO1]